MASTTAGNSHIISNMTFGADAAGVDLKVFGDTTGYYLLWDASANKLINYGALDVGVSGTGHDVTFYGDTAGCYLQWDQDADKLILTGKQTIGLAQGTTGIALTGTDPDQALQVHACLSTMDVPQGAYAGIWSTMSISEDQDEDVSAFAVWGELWLDSTDLTGASHFSALWGNVIISATSVSSTGNLAGVWGVVNSPQGMTNNGRIAGVMADSELHASMTNAGTIAAFYATKGDGKLAWPYGLYLTASSCATGIFIGTGATYGIDSDSKVRFGTAQGATGISLDGTDPDQVFQAHASIETAGVAAGAYAGTWSTMSISEDQDEDVSAFGVWSELWLNQVDLTGASNFGALWGNVIVSATSTSSTGNLAGVMSSVNGPELFTNNGRIVGVTVDSELHAGMTNSGHIAGYDVRAGSGKFPWTYGLYLAASACTNGIFIGTTTTTGIDFNGAMVNNMVVTTVPTGTDGGILKAGTSGGHLEAASAGGQLHLFVDNAATSGSNRVVRVETLSSGTSTALKNYAIRGTAGIKTAVTAASGAWCIGVQGKIENAGALVEGTTSAAVLAQIGNGGTYGSGAILYGAWIDNQLAATPTSDNTWMLGITNTVADCVFTGMIRAYGAASYLLDLEPTAGGWTNSTATCSTEGGMIAVLVQGAVRYIQLYTGYSG